MWNIQKQIWNNYSSNRFLPLEIVFHYKTFRKTYNFLRRSQWWSRSDLKAYQSDQLAKLLNHAYKNVPYYKKIFDKDGLKPWLIKDYSDFKKIPFLTKEIVRENVNNLKAINYPEHKFEHITTGGSTGIPLGFYAEKGVWRAKELAYVKSLYDRVGLNFLDKFVEIRGYINPLADKGKFWKHSFFGRCLNLSSFHMNRENLPKYIEKIRKFRPKFITAYPSTISILGRFMKKNNIEPFKTVKTIICGAEVLYDWQRELLKEIFQCRIYNIYGHFERCVLAGACEHSDYFHIFPEYGFVELIGKDGGLVKQEGEKGEIVVTGFNNLIFPFIRYRTGDIGTYTAQKCSCGRNYSLFKRVEGRIQAYIITRRNRPISMVNLFCYFKNIFNNVKQFQFYQEKKGELLLRIVRTDAYTKQNTESIKEELCKRLGQDIDLDIEFVDDIPRTARGKHSYLIQKLPVDVGDLW